MPKRRYRNLSIRGPVTLFVVVLVLILTLTVLWNVVLVHDYNKLRELAAQESSFHGTFVILGSALFVTIIVLSSILGAQLIGHLRWSQRQSDFIASVSHELNSPLSSIKLFAQTLRKGDLSTTDRQSFVHKILDDVERLSRLIANILRAAELDSRGEELQVVVEEVELYGYLEEYLADAAAIHEDHAPELSLAGDRPLWVPLDRLMFRQVLDNLIDNAIRYRGRQPPRVEVEARRRGDRAVLRLRDGGIGISDAELPKIFDRFYRAPSASSRKGTGIGLFVVRSIVLAHGGRVDARSDGPGRGTEIVIALPLAVRPDAVSADAAGADAVSTDAADAGAAA